MEKKQSNILILCTTFHPRLTAVYFVSISCLQYLRICPVLINPHGMCCLLVSYFVKFEHHCRTRHTFGKNNISKKIHSDMIIWIFICIFLVMVAQKWTTKGSVLLSLFMDANGKCKLPFTSPNPTLNRKQDLHMIILNFKTFADVFI